MGNEKENLQRSMEELKTATLEVLVNYFDGRPVRCGRLGDLVFHDVIESKGHHNGSAPFARIQGKVMKQLECEGLARLVTRSGYWGWVITESGRKRLQE